MSLFSKRAAAPLPSKPGPVADIEAEDLPTDTRTPIRLGFWVLIVGFGGFLAWASLAPLDQGVAAQATVAIETKRRVIQHMTGGVVANVLVKEGQEVREGDVLVELGEATVRANFESVRQNYLGLRAAESRVLSEQAERSSIAFHKDLTTGSTGSLVAEHISAQTRLFNARRSALDAELSAARESIAGLQAQVAGLASMLKSRKSQAELLAEQARNIRSLAAEGYAPRNQVLQLEQSQAELTATIADLEANRARALQSIAELKMRMAQRRQEYQKEASAELAAVRREVQAGEEKLKAATEELARVRIKSPVDGQVVGLAVTALGGVVTPGQRLMDIVPEGEALLLDAKIPPHVIDRIKVGDPVDVRFSAFANTPTLVLDGKLVSLSGDALTEGQGPTTMTYYLGRVEVTAEGLRRLGDRVMQPGMPAEVIVKTGERSLLTYLLHPLVKRVAASMKEE